MICFTNRMGQIACQGGGVAIGTHTQLSVLASLAYVIFVAPLLPRHLALLLDLQKLVSPEKTVRLHSNNSRAPRNYNLL